MAARWRMPPENSCGYLLPDDAGIPTSSSNSPARFRAAAAELPPCSTIGSAICDSTVRTGLSAFMAP